MRKRLLVSTAAIIIAGFFIAFSLVAHLVQLQSRQAFTHRLDAIVTLLKTQTQAMEQNPQAFAVSAGRQLAQTEQTLRITVIDATGTVVGDSAATDATALPAETHRNRSELQQAQTQSIGYDLRTSATTGIAYYYAAARAENGYFVRVALPASQLQSAAARIWLCAMVASAISSAVVLLLTWWVLYLCAKPLRQLSAAAQQMAQGETVSLPPAGTDEIGRLSGALQHMSNHTRQAVEELQHQQHQLESVLQGMRDGVLAVDMQNNILFLNDSARALLGVSSLQTGKAFEGSLLVSKVAAFVQQTLQQNSARHDTIAVSEGVQGERILTVYATPIQNKNETAVLAVITDITHVSHLEQLRSEFVANVTHELKTPLTSIRGSIELLKSANRDEETCNYFYDVLDIEAERLHHLIDDMLVLSQIENARPEQSDQRCDVAHEITQTVARLAPIAEKLQVTLQTQLQSGIFVACSATRLQQMLGNLIENAIKYNQQSGTVFITAEIVRQMAVIRIQDTGIGIAEEHFPRLFERFYRVDASRSRAIGGTGLGLSIVKHLAVLYGGEISVESTVGKGTTFTVRLPLLLPEKT